MDAQELIAASYVCERAGDMGGAFRQAHASLKQARAAGKPEDIAAALVCVAHLHFRQGHYDEARETAAAALSQSGPEHRTWADGLLILGLCAAETDDPDTAETYYHRAADVSRRLGYQRALRSALHNLSATVYVPRGQFELALAADEESYRLALALDMPEVAWFPLATMGWVYWITNRRGRALATTETLKSCAAPESLAEGFYFCLRADLAQEGAEPETAPALYTQARAIAEGTGDPGLNVLVRLGLSRFHRSAGSVAAANDWAKDALTIATRVGYHHLQGMSLIERGLAAWQLDELDAAEADLKEAVTVLKPVQAHYDLARSYFYMAALAQQRDAPGAASLWVEAVSRIISGGYVFLLERERALSFPLLASHLNSTDANVATLSDRLLAQLALEPPPALHIQTLGHFGVRQGQRLIPQQAWRQRRAGELFRILLISPSRTVPRDRLIQALWPDKSAKSARALFHQATSSLRRVLEPDLPDKFPSRYLRVEGGLVSLQLAEDSQVDFETFAAHLESKQWAAALACYQGELFPSDMYADWSAARREHLRQQCVRAAISLARAALHAGQPDQSLAASRRALALEPWQEEAALVAMEAYVAQGDRAGAIHLYRQLERTLCQELAIAPQASLRTLYQSLVQA